MILYYRNVHPGRETRTVRRPIWASVKLGDTLGCQFGWKQLTEFDVVLAVILINDTFVANLYKWSSLIRIIVCQNVSLANTSHKRCRQFRYEIDHSVAKL